MKIVFTFSIEVRTISILEEIIKVNPDNPLEYCRKQIAPFAINKLNGIISKCKECATACHNNKRLFKGNPNANFMLVTDHATNDERIYEYLENIMKQAGIELDDVFYVNSVNCINTREFGDKRIVRSPSSKETTNCKLYIKNAIDIIKPRIIILMGASSLNVFNKDNCLIEEINNWKHIYGIPVITTYSPQDIFAFSNILDEEMLEEKASVLLGDLMKANMYINRGE